MVKASALPDRVPYGFICGFPTKNGDLYGGTMYLRSASVGAQAEAILTASASWGIGPAGREEIPFPSHSGEAHQAFRRAPWLGKFCNVALRAPETSIRSSPPSFHLVCVQRKYSKFLFLQARQGERATT
ncbi:hypothetical protein CYMTET_6249 [Cymbomonas tetramitiformis]|uniref:Uncharacterized protein n=1 Tax=Cymbomonas tetramitiformis TaxID=36881 RepID=A0AAE0GXH5_9CHLO|nr:hypothetical protein CYMTET_6249 [Cymbomonas tetramitiformis]